jgi:hypothetical protein
MSIKSRRTFFWLFTGVVIFLCTGAALCGAVGQWLAVNDPLPARLDVLFSFGGENARVAYSRGLMERFPGAQWVISDNFLQYSRILSREGFNMSKVTVLDTCRYTLSEVRALAVWLKDNRDSLVSAAAVDIADLPVRVGLVSSPCHMRRIRFMVRDVVRDTSFQCYCLPVPLERYGWTSSDLRHWWRTKALRTWVLSETAKILWYWLSSWTFRRIDFI